MVAPFLVRNLALGVPCGVAWFSLRAKVVQGSQLLALAGLREAYESM
jgi:hypothetical protein